MPAKPLKPPKAATETLNVTLPGWAMAAMERDMFEHPHGPQKFSMWVREAVLAELQRRGYRAP